MSRLLAIWVRCIEIDTHRPRRLPLSEHPSGYRGLPGGDPGLVVGLADRGMLVIRKPSRDIGYRHDLDDRPVRRRQFARQSLPAQLQVAATMAGRLQPV